MPDATTPRSGPLTPRPVVLPSTPPPGRAGASRMERSAPATLRITPWSDPAADPHGVHPCSRYVELYWLGVVGPSTAWLLRRLSYGLELNEGGFNLDLAETAASLGLGDRMGKNSPFSRALRRLSTFELARPQGPGMLAVRVRIPPLPLRHLRRLPHSLQVSHQRWMSEQQLSEAERMHRRAHRLATSLATAGHNRLGIEDRLAAWQFHPAVAFDAADVATRQSGADPIRSQWPVPDQAAPLVTVSQDRPRDLPG
jgi:hypothetical protein